MFSSNCNSFCSEERIQQDIWGNGKSPVSDNKDIPLFVILLLSESSFSGSSQQLENIIETAVDVL
jgi:hypothetical protein